MTENVIEPPFAGGKMRASWGASVARAVNAHEAELQSLRQPGKWQSLRVEDAETLAPFTVRLHKTEDDPGGQWEIYLPPGCCNVGGTCDPLNPPASDTSGHEDDDPAWRSLGTINWNQIDAAEYRTVEAGTTVGVLKVYVDIHVKPSAKLYGVDSLNLPARRLVWAGLRNAAMDNYTTLNALGLQRHYKDTPGDAWTGRVATISRERDSTLGDMTITQHRTTPVDVALPQDTGVGGFDLVWSLSHRTSSDIFTLELDVKDVYCVRQLFAVAGIAVTGDQMTDVEGAEWVYAKIHADDMSNGADIVEVVADPGNDVYSGDTNIVWLPLYQLKHNTVSADHREASLKNVQLYRA